MTGVNATPLQERNEMGAALIIQIGVRGGRGLLIEALGCYGHLNENEQGIYLGSSGRSWRSTTGPQRKFMPPTEDTRNRTFR